MKAWRFSLWLSLASLILIALRGEVVERGPNHNLHQVVSSDENGEAKTNKWVELQGGLNFLDENGKYVPSSVGIDLDENGGAAFSNGPFKVRFRPNYSDIEGLQITFPDGKTLKIQTVGIALTDSGTGESVWIGELQNAQGFLASSNEISYPDAFRGIRADIDVSIGLGRFQHDICLKEAPINPRLLGLDPERCRLEVWHRIIDGPMPERKSLSIRRADGTMDTDERLEFGGMLIGQGTAFLVGTNRSSHSTPNEQEGHWFDHQVAVAKELYQPDAQSPVYLIESVPYTEALSKLKSLPEQHQAYFDSEALMQRSASGQRAASSGKRSKPVSLATTELDLSITGKERQIASITRSERAIEPGFLLDYTVVITTNNMRFAGNLTYLVSGTVAITGTTVLEGGTVIKYSPYTTTNTPYVVPYGPLICETSPMAPAIFTAETDNTVGEVVNTNQISGRYGWCLGYTADYPLDLHDVHFRYATYGITLGNTNIKTLSNIQAVECTYPILSTSTNVYVRNYLAYKCRFPLYGYNAVMRAEHVTEHCVDQVFYSSGGNSTLYITNSLAAVVTNSSSGVVSDHLFTLTSDAGVFDTVKAGAHYLAKSSPYRRAGTAVSSQTKAVLKGMTTYAPLELTDNILVDTTLSPRVPRDGSAETPSIGYHYPALDYIASSLAVADARLTLTNGVAIGAYGPTLFKLQGSGELISAGLPDRPNHLVTFEGIQEQPMGLITNNAFAFFSGFNANLRFTYLSTISGTALSRQLINVGTFDGTIAIRDSTLRNVTSILLDNHELGLSPQVDFKNNIVDRCYFEFDQASDSPSWLGLTLRNNLFLRTTLMLAHFGSDLGEFDVRDNFFDNCTLYLDEQGGPPYETWGGPMVSGNNGYTSATATFGGSNNKTVASPDYQVGALGRWYYPTSGGNLSSLIEAGSQTAANAGLYHYTVRTDQTKDSGSVDIGFHFVAVDGSGIPLDYEPDGIPDYLEDRDGDGVSDSNETSWVSADTDGDNIPDGWEVSYGFDPLVEDGNDDFDGDWITNLDEYAAGSNPKDNLVLAWGIDSAGCAIVPLGIHDAKAVAGGRSHSVVLRNDGTVFAWGDNSQGQTNVPAAATNVIAITVGEYHNLALRNDGTVIPWGKWHPDVSIFSSATIDSSATNVIAVAAGTDHDIALRSDGTIVVWGYIATDYNTHPASISNRVVAIGASDRHSLAVLDDHTVQAWGPDFITATVPAGLTGVTSVAAGWHHTVALKSDGTIAAWGAGQSDSPFGGLWNYGQSIVPSNATNIIAVAAGGDHSHALAADGKTFHWGESSNTLPAYAATNNVAVGAGLNHALAIRSGRGLPIITSQPVDAYALQGSNASFTVAALSLAGCAYQWQSNSVNISGATNATLALSNVQSSFEATYRCIVSTGAGSITSSNASFTILVAPRITSITPANNSVLVKDTSVRSLSVAVVAAGTNVYPLTYSWYKNGVQISGASSSSYAFIPSSDPTEAEADYSVIVSNAAGATSNTWKVLAYYPGMVAAWGNSLFSQTARPSSLTNAIAIAAGSYHSVAATDTGDVVQWGYEWAAIPSSATNVAAVAAGDDHSLALRRDGTVISWGSEGSQANFVPESLSNVRAIASGWDHNLALLSNTTVVAWGSTNFFGPALLDVPAGLTNVIAIAAGAGHSLALKSDSTVVGWGYNAYGQASPPSGLTNVVAIAAGAGFSLALKVDGTVTAWGGNGSGQCNVPANLTNAMAIAGGWYHGVALRNDGTVISWGSYGSSESSLAGISEVKLIAAGGNFSEVVRFGMTVEYPIDVSKDVLLIYNENSASGDSVYIKNYYKANRPLMAGVNLCPINTTLTEHITNSDFAPTIVAPIQAWLDENPTKHPNYFILSHGIPSRFWNDAGNGVAYELHSSISGIRPIITVLNMGSTNATRAYIDKLASIGMLAIPGQPYLSAGTSYGSTNFVFDGIRRNFGVELYASYSGTVSNAMVAVATSGNSTLAYRFQDGIETYSGEVNHLLTTCTNISGYMSWGVHGSLPSTYPTDGTLQWSGNSGWWTILTLESFNGQVWQLSPQGNFVGWFSSNAFGGANFSNTPVAAVGNVTEPMMVTAGVNGEKYFKLWATGKPFGGAVWSTQEALRFQAFGDPFVKQ